jgi:NAD+ synthase (glutamine-hydrolysing)
VKDVAYSADGISVCYEVQGSGEPALVFVHGWSCDRSYWSRQLDHFAGLHKVAARLADEGLGGIAVVTGYLDRRTDLAPRTGVPAGAPLDAAALLHGGRVVITSAKHHLPNYGVFDEYRYFVPGSGTCVVRVHGVDVALVICEDLWQDGGPVAATRAAGAGLLLVVNGSPYELAKDDVRLELCRRRAAEAGCTLAYLNMVGGQDELVFDGASLIVDERGECVARGLAFEEDFVVADLDLEAVFRARLHDSRRRKEKLRSGAASTRVALSPLPAREQPALPARAHDVLEPVEEIYQALVLGTRDYVTKTGFRHAVIGLSGGIDSALVAAIACDALGPANVTGVTMPSPFSSGGTRRDAARLARNLGIEFMRLPITPVFAGYRRALAKAFKGVKEDVTEENLQARIRGNYLMALSNKFGWLVLTTANKSEMAVGYSTLYGDMAGGFAVIKDVPKMLVYQLAEHANARAGRELIPRSIFDRAPSAELRPDQTDQDSLPPYPELDAILEAYVEGDQGKADIVARGFDEATVKRVIAMVDKNEYKRRQGPIGIKITPRAFGKDWRLPIVNRFQE